MLSGLNDPYIFNVIKNKLLYNYMISFYSPINFETVKILDCVATTRVAMQIHYTWALVLLLFLAVYYLRTCIII